MKRMEYMLEGVPRANLKVFSKTDASNLPISVPAYVCTLVVIGYWAILLHTPHMHKTAFRTLVMTTETISTSGKDENLITLCQATAATLPPLFTTLLPPFLLSVAGATRGWGSELQQSKMELVISYVRLHTPHPHPYLESRKSGDDARGHKKVDDTANTTRLFRSNSTS